MQWLINFIKSLFGGGSGSPKPRSMDINAQNLYLGPAYHWSLTSADSLAQQILKCGATGLGVELSELGGSVTDVVPYFTKQIDKLVPYAAACRKYGLILKVTILNSNIPGGHLASLSQWEALFDYFVKKIGTQNVLVLAVSEDDSNTPAATRSGLRNYVASKWPKSQLISMDNLFQGAAFLEAHVSHVSQVGQPNKGAKTFAVSDTGSILAEVGGGKGGTLNINKFVAWEAQCLKAKETVQMYDFTEKLDPTFANSAGSTFKTIVGR